MRCQRSGDRTTRRMIGNRRSIQEPGDRTVGSDHEVFDELLRAVSGIGHEPTDASPSNSARTSTVSSSSAPCAWRSALRRCATSSCSRRFSANPATRAAAGGSGAFALKPCPHAVVCQLRLVAHHGLIDVRRTAAALCVDNHVRHDRDGDPAPRPARSDPYSAGPAAWENSVAAYKPRWCSFRRGHPARSPTRPQR